MSASDIANQLEVSSRTINRDIDELCKSGIPIITQRGAGGGVYISKNFTIDKTLLTKDEVENMLIGLKSLDSISIKPLSINLLQKIGYDTNNTTKSIAVNDCISIDLSSHYKATLSNSIVTIKKAIEDNILIEINYTNINGVKDIYVEPYFLLFKWSSWYLYGYDTVKEDYRLYKLNRIISLTTSNEIFSPKNIKLSDIDVDSYFVNNIYLKAVFKKSAMYRLVDEYGVNSFEEINDELYFERYFTNKHYLIEWILSFGSSVKVLEPQTIKDEVIMHIKKLNEIYL